MVLLLSLPPSYTALVTTLSAPGEFKLDVIANGIMEYECQTAMLKTDIGSDQALYVAVKPRETPQERWSVQKHTCNQPGHFAPECTSAMATTNYSNVRNNTRRTAAPASGDHARKPRHRRGPKHKAKVVMEESEDGICILFWYRK